MSSRPGDVVGVWNSAFLVVQVRYDHYGLFLDDIFVCGAGKEVGMVEQ